MKQNYKDLGFKRYVIYSKVNTLHWLTRYGLFSILGSLFTRITRAAISEVRVIFYYDSILQIVHVIMTKVSEEKSHRFCML